MPITLVPYDSNWPARFREARSELVQVMDAKWIVAVEHVGSTAVPSLSAKPIIDMLVGVRTMESVVCADEALRGIGYLPWFGADGRVSYERRDDQGQPTEHTHFVAYGGLLWHSQLAFRDALRANRRDREAYERLKRDLAAKCTDTRDYSEAKSPFVRSVLSRT